MKREKRSWKSITVILVICLAVGFLLGKKEIFYYYHFGRHVDETINICVSAKVRNGLIRSKIHQMDYRDYDHFTIEEFGYILATMDLSLEASARLIKRSRDLTGELSANNDKMRNTKLMLMIGDYLFRVLMLQNKVEEAYKQMSNPDNHQRPQSLADKKGERI